MARVDATGAEVGHINELDSVTIGGTGGTRTFTSITDGAPGAVVPPRSGLRSWLARQEGESLAGSIYGTLILAAMGTGCVRFSVAFNDEGIVSQIPFLTLTNSTSGQGIQIQRDNTSGRWMLAFVSATGTPAGFISVSADTSAGKWHEISLRWSIAGATKQAHVSINNSPEVTAIANASITITSINRCNLGVAAPPVTGTPGGGCVFQYDDIIIDDANARIDHGRFLVGLRPNSDVLKDLVIPASGTHFDDVSDNADATFVRTSLVGAQFDMFGLTDSGVSGVLPTLSRTIPAVYGSIRAGAATDSAAAVSQRIGFQLAGVNNTLVQPTVSLSATTKRSIMVNALNPSGAAWSPANLDALQMFVGKNASTVADSYTFIEAWVTAEVAVHVNAAEAVAVADVVSSIKNSVPLSDTVTVVDVITSLTNRFERVEVVALVDNLTSLKASTNISETVTVDEQVTSLKAWLALNESVLVEDTTAIFVRAQISLSDEIVLTDEITSLKSSLYLEDSAVEVVTFEQMTFISILLCESGGGGGGGTTIIIVEVHGSAKVTGSTTEAEVIASSTKTAIEGSSHQAKTSVTEITVDTDASSTQADTEGKSS